MAFVSALLYKRIILDAESDVRIDGRPLLRKFDSAVVVTVYSMA